jgi:hypothetical protein
LEQPGEKPACGLRFRYYIEINGEEAEAICREIERCVTGIWLPGENPVQTLSRIYGDDSGRWRNVVELRFDRRIGEEQMDDIPELAKHAVMTLEALCGLSGVESP